MIVIPMAGLSRRFMEAGYTQPKYMLQAHGRTLFDHSVLSFSDYFASEAFLFIVRDVQGTPDFVRARAQDLGIADYRVITLNRETAGQAETVALGLRAAQAQEVDALTIFNIDTFRPGFRLSTFPAEEVAGYLEVFSGSGANWSYVLPSADDKCRALATTEKNPISDLCCTGLYHFASRILFEAAYEDYTSDPDRVFSELYVAPNVQLSYPRWS